MTEESPAKQPRPGSTSARVPIYRDEFAADPHHFYREMRAAHGSLVPVELAPDVPATLVIGHRTALRILNDPDRFPPDPRVWERSVPPECPVRPMLQWRPIASKNVGRDFLRYRAASISGLARVDLFTLSPIVASVAEELIARFRDAGAAELIGEYLSPLLFRVVNHILGCPPAIGQELALGVAAALEGTVTAESARRLEDALMRLVELKRVTPGPDMTSSLVARASGLDDVEVAQHILQTYATGYEFQLNLIANALLLILADEEFGDNVIGGSVTARDALDAVLYDDPPAANLLPTFPRQPILIDDVWLPAHEPVLISIAACNNDPDIRAEDMTGNRAHLAWGAGSHTCPATDMAYIIATAAIDQLLDALPEMSVNFPGGTPHRRPGPFHRALADLPVRF